MKRVRWAFFFVYSVFVVLAIAYYELFIHVDPGNSELSGLPLIVLGLPWSVGIPQIIGMNDPSHFISSVALVGGIVFNAAILRLLGGISARIVARTSSNHSLQ